LYHALACFETGISVWLDPEGWMNANANYVVAVVLGYFQADIHVEYVSFIGNYMIYQVCHLIIDIMKYAMV
jgi:hypothetical protein